MPFASGKHALGICDRCGFQYPYSELQDEISDEKPTGVLVCETCLDPDHPQLQVKKLRVTDYEGLEHARPDDKLATGMFGWNPVGSFDCEMVLNGVFVQD